MGRSEERNAHLARRGGSVRRTICHKTSHISDFDLTNYITFERPRCCSVVMTLQLLGQEKTAMSREPTWQ